MNVLTAELAVRLAERTMDTLEMIFDLRWNNLGIGLHRETGTLIEVPADFFTRMPCEADPTRANPAWDEWRWARRACVNDIREALNHATSSSELMKATAGALRSFRAVALRAALLRARSFRGPDRAYDRGWLETKGLCLAQRIEASLRLVSDDEDAEVKVDTAALTVAKERAGRARRATEDRAEADLVVAALLRGEVSSDRLRKRAREVRPAQDASLLELAAEPLTDATAERVAAILRANPNLMDLLKRARASVPGHDEASMDPGPTPAPSAIVPECPAPTTSAPSRKASRPSRAGSSASGSGASAKRSASRSNPKSGAKTPRKAAR